jgi:hypothetical protein
VFAVDFDFKLLIFVFISQNQLVKKLFDFGVKISAHLDLDSHIGVDYVFIIPFILLFSKIHSYTIVKFLLFLVEVLVPSIF